MQINQIIKNWTKNQTLEQRLIILAKQDPDPMQPH